jgi:hypothetical protein
MTNNLPPQVTKYFWGDDLSQLNWQDHRRYITKTILEKGDSSSISWLFGKLNKKQILSQLSTLELSEKSRNFWQIYLS